MSLVDEEIEDLYIRDLKEKIDARWRLQRQLERCNLLAIEAASSEEKYEAFRQAVEVLLGDLPIRIRKRVEAREEDYVIKGGPEWHYIYNAGVPMGTPDDPVCDEHGNPISPVLVQQPDEVDPFALLSVIKEELEKGGLTWEYREEHKAIRKIGEPLPEGIVSRAEQMLVRFIRQVRAENPELKIGWRQLVGELLQRSPEIPLFEEEEE